MPLSNVLALLVFAGIVILFIALAVGGTVLGARRFAETSTRLEQQALERGWQYHGYREGGTTAHNFSGTTDGISWQIESYYHHSPSSESSSDSVRYTRWWTEAAVLSGEVILLIPNMGNAFQVFGTGRTVPGGMTGLVGDLIQMFLRHFVTSVLRAAPEDARAFDNVQQVQAGSDALRQRYTVIATSQKTAGRFLDEDAERMLMDLAPEKWGDTQKLRVTAVVYWHKGIQLVTQDQITEIGKLKQLVQLGLALVSGQKSSVWS